MTVPNFFTVAFPTPLIESKSERVVGLEMQMDFAIRALRNDRCVAQKVVMSSSFFDIVGVCIDKRKFVRCDSCTTGRGIEVKDVSTWS